MGPTVPTRHAAAADDRPRVVAKVTTSPPSVVTAVVTAVEGVVGSKFAGASGTITIIMPALLPLLPSPPPSDLGVSTRDVAPIAG
jgi:hypothetical protein